MVGNLQPLSNTIPITDKNGNPLDYFIQLLQKIQLNVEGGITEEQAEQLIDAWAASRTINTTAPLAGGGTLANDLTLTHNDSGVVAGAYTAANITVDAKGHVTVAASGTGGGAWTLVSTTTIGSPVPNIDIPSLGSFNEILVIGRLLTMSVSGFRFCRLSVDNGSTFYSTSGNYVNVDTAGVETNGTDVGGHNTSASAARTILMNLVNNLSGGPKLIRSVTVTTAPNQLFVASTLPVNAVRVMSSTGNLTGGTIYVFGR